MASHSGSVDLFHMHAVLTDRNHVFERTCTSRPATASADDTEPEARSRTFMDCLRGMIAVAFPNWHLPKLHDTEDDTKLPIPTVYFRNPLLREEVAALLRDNAPRTVDELPGRFTLPQQPGSNLAQREHDGIELAILRGNDGNRLEDQTCCSTMARTRVQATDKLQPSTGEGGRSLVILAPGWNIQVADRQIRAAASLP